MNNQQFVELVKNFSMNVMSSNAVEEKHILSMCNISLVNLFQVMNSATTIWEHSLEIEDIKWVTEYELLKDPLKIIEVSSKNNRVILNRKMDLDMITNGNGEILSHDWEYITINYQLNGKEMKIDSKFTGKVYYIRKPKFLTEQNFAEEVDFPIETLWYMLFHTLFGLMPFVLSEGRTLANGHYEHAKELLNKTISLMNTWMTSFTTR